MVNQPPTNSEDVEFDRFKTKGIYMTTWLDKNNIAYRISADGLICVDGDITIRRHEDVVLKTLAEVSGSVDVGEGATFTAPALAKVSGTVDVRGGATFTAPVLAKVSGFVYVGDGATFTAPALAEASDYVDVSKDATFTAPALTEVSGSVDVGEGATFTAPALAEVSGSVYVRGGATFTAPVLVKSGYVYVRGGATFTAPVLAEVSGTVDVRGGATFTAPVLAKVSGFVNVSKDATFTAPVLAKVSGFVNVEDGATFTAPALVTIGHVAYRTRIFECDIEVFDNIGCVVISRKSKDANTIRYCRKAEFKNRELIGKKFYIASNDKYNAHANTAREAMQELLFKSGNRDISEYRNMPITTVKGPKEWAFIYRMITGACETGIEMFMKSQKLKEQYNLEEILEHTSNQWGAEKFRSVVRRHAMPIYCKSS